MDDIQREYECQEGVRFKCGECAEILYKFTNFAAAAI